MDSLEFRGELLGLLGVGRKTIDYMACLVGLDSLAVDRHVRTFANRSGIESTDYETLKRTFCFAADLLKSSRRQFDAWVWQIESSKVLDQQEPTKMDDKPDTDITQTRSRA